MCRPVDGPHGAPPVPQYAPAPDALVDDAPAEDAPIEDAPQETALQRERRWMLIGMMRDLRSFFLH
ncbi:hypothetical protein L195_g062701 [Trifolium pratense]|uniref:Uncharacterized protein n=1 Tax=Trifolium pratense TaxID=57577 RepID=A0A2K3KH70_TRIPR|nr:hypothetical protein L195_g062701 [Trifolium pratense]